MPSLQVNVLAVSGGAAGKSYIAKLVAGGKEFKTGKTKKDGSIGELVTIDGSPDSVQVVLLQKDKQAGSVTVSVAAQAEGEASTEWHQLGGGLKIQLATTCVGYGSKKGSAKKKPAGSSSASPRAGGDSDIPMPLERLHILYAQFVSEMGVGPEVQAQMMALPDKDKYALLSQKKLVERERDTTASLDQKPTYWLQKVKAEPTVETFKKLQIRLSHELVTWLTEFHGIGGVAELIAVLNRQNVAKKKTEAEALVSKGVIQCLTSFMDNQAGLNLVNDTPKALLTIAATYVDKSLDYDTRAQAIKLLSVVTLVDGGHENVLNALNELMEKTGDKSRFSAIVSSIKKTRDSKLRAVLMTFLNAICNRPDELVTRVNLRAELSAVGFDDVLLELNKVEDSPELDNQIQVYTDEKELDEKEQKAKFDHVPDVKLEDPENVFHGIQSIAKNHRLDDYFLEVLQNLLAIRLDANTERGREQWVLATKLLRYICGMKMRKDASKSDIERILASLLKAVSAEASDHFQLSELKEANNKAQRELATKAIEAQEKHEQIKKLEAELTEAQTKAQASQTALDQIKANPPATTTVVTAPVVVAEPSTSGAETAALESKNRTLQSDVERLQKEVAALKTSLDEANVAVANAAAAAAAAANNAANADAGAGAGGPPPPPPAPGGPPPPPMMGGGPPPPPPMMGGGPPPPPPPGMGGPPGPPPPPGMGGPPGPPPPPGMGGPPPPPGMGGPPPPPGMGGPPPPMMGKMAAAAPKKRPEVIPTQKVRNFQWTKLPEAKVRGTFFAELPLELSSFKLDFTAVETSFAQVEVKKAEGATGAAEPKKKEGPVTVLDPKTSQNLSIFLNGFRSLKYAQVAKAIQNLDESVVSGQQIATLGTVWPTPEDIAQVTEYASSGGDVSKLAPAEQFVLELNAVPALLQRMKAFRFKSEYETKKAEIKPDIQSVHTACKQVRASEKLRSLLEIVLHVGNFLNQGGNKGQSWGFKLRDLQKLGEAKTTDNKSNLLTVLVELVQREKADLLEVAKDLDAIEAAQRVNLQQLQSELAKLTKELEVVKNSASTVPSAGEDDQYHAKVTEFSALMTEEVTKMNSDLTDMQAAYEAVVTYFVEDPKTMGPDEFFALFTTFVKSLDETVKKIEAARIAAEKAEKRGAAKASGAAAKKVGLPGLAGAKKGMGMPGQGAVVNELFGQLAAGNPFKNRRRAGDEGEAATSPRADAPAPESPKTEAAAPSEAQ
jgi:hypothetical protein